MLTTTAGRPEVRVDGANIGEPFSTALRPLFDDDPPWTIAISELVAVLARAISNDRGGEPVHIRLTFGEIDATDD